MTTITIDRAVLEQVLNDIDTCTNALSEALNAPQPTAMQDWEAIAADQAMTIAMQAATIESLKEQRLMQMTAITTAALGYWKEGDSILPDYDTTALRDVAKLYAKYEALNAPQPEPVEDRRLKVKLGNQYGSDLDGNWFYLRPADVFAEAALFNHTGIGPQHLYSPTPPRVGAAVAGSDQHGVG